MDRHIEIMGIVNLTDDSFFSGSRCSGVDAALSRIDTMLSEGADIIDLGACSTRPGSMPVGEDEEWIRLEPVLKALKTSFPDIRLSIDTYWASVVRRTCGLIGDFIVNDISAGEDDPLMLPTVGELGLTYIAMHKRGNPATMSLMTDYEDVALDVKAYFDDFVGALSLADRLAILDTYGARENKIQGADSIDLVRAISTKCAQSSVEYIKSDDKTIEYVKMHKNDYDNILFLGAGDIYLLKDKLMGELDDVFGIEVQDVMKVF